MCEQRQRGVTLPARPMSTSPSPAAHAAAHARAATADDAACSQDLEEVVAAGLQTCSANVCMTHMRTAARSHTHCDQLSNASAAHFVREDEDPCKMTYSRMALIERDLSATTQMQMHSQMGFSCSNRRAAQQRQDTGAAHTRHGGARLARTCVTETPQAESGLPEVQSCWRKRRQRSWEC